MILHGLIVLLIFWAIFSRTHRIKADVSAMKRENAQDHDILAREVLRHREMILRQEEEIAEMKHQNESDHEVIAKSILEQRQKTKSHVEKTANFEEFFAAEVERHKQMILDHEERINRNTSDIQKQNEQIYKIKNRLAQAEEDINYFASQIENLKKYSEYLEEQRSKSPEGSGEWHKWNNKMLTNDGKIYTFTTRMNKAQFAADEARRKLEVA